MNAILKEDSVHIKNTEHSLPKLGQRVGGSPRLLIVHTPWNRGITMTLFGLRTCDSGLLLATEIYSRNRSTWPFWAYGIFEEGDDYWDKIKNRWTDLLWNPCIFMAHQLKLIIIINVYHLMKNSQLPLSLHGCGSASLIGLFL